MTKVKKLLFGLGGVALMATPVVAVTSCGSSNSSAYATTDIGGIKTTFGDDLIKEMEEKVKEIKNGDDESLKSLVENQPIIHITSAGVVNDNSFNQMTWEAVSHFSNILGVKKSTCIETKTGSDNEMFDAFDAALNNGCKIWVLTGWSQESPFSKWIQKGTNFNKFKENNIRIIAIDWDASSYVPEGHSISLNFKTQESSFLIGYSVSKFLAEQYPGEENKDKRIVNTTSGADAAGSSNFNYGFLEGVRTWNSEQSSNDTKISTNIYKNEEKIWLNTTYIANNPTAVNDFKLSYTGKGDKIYKEATPTIVMPVAGDWSRTAAEGIKEGQWVVGVDSNMAISYGSALASKFITSSEKRVAISVFKALSFIAGLSSINANLNPDSSQTSYTLNKDGLIENNGELASWNIVGGINQRFVGASASTIKDAELAKKFDNIVKETQEKFFENQQTKLENTVDQSLLEKFKNASDAEFNDAVFNLKNVFYGYMTAGNQDYFNKVAEEINSWLK